MAAEAWPPSGSVAGQTAGQVYQGAVAPTPYPAWFGAMAEAIKRVEDLCERIDTVATSLVGSYPQPPNAEAKAPNRATGGVFGDIEDIGYRTSAKAALALVQVGRIFQQLPKT